MNLEKENTILIVDDEPDVRFVLKAALEKNGFKTEMAADGQEALERVRANRPNAILLDIMMPKMDGFSVNQKLKENPQTMNIPVVIITGKGQVKELFELRKDFQVVAYLEKPFPISILIEKLKEIFSPSGQLADPDSSLGGPSSGKANAAEEGRKAQNEIG